MLESLFQPMHLISDPGNSVVGVRAQETPRAR